jgi:hypothetical protein
MRFHLALRIILSKAAFIAGMGVAPALAAVLHVLPLH